LYDEAARRGRDSGLCFNGLSIDFGAVIDRSRKVADRLAKGVAGLLRKAGVTVLPGRGVLRGGGAVEVVRGEERSRVAGRWVLLAVGSRPRMLPGLEPDGEVVFTSRQALAHRRLPESIVVIGGGAVGVEFAYAYACFGVEVTLVEMESRLLPGLDGDVAAELQRQLHRRGVKVLAGARFREVRRGASGGEVMVAAGGEQRRLAAQAILVAVGRTPRSAGIGIEEAGVVVENGFVRVGPDLQTSAAGVFAVGDLIGPPLLAHKAAAEGVAAVANMAGEGGREIDYRRIPACVYCQPEVACIGLTEEQAAAEGRECSSVKLPFLAVGKAVAAGHTEGFVKLVVDRSCGAIAGCHIIGKGATDLIAEVALAMALESTTSEIGDTIHAHPTLSEAIMEAALHAEGRSINF